MEGGQVGVWGLSARWAAWAESLCPKGTEEGPCLIATQHTIHLREQPGSKGPTQIQGDCSCLPNLPGEGSPLPGSSTTAPRT